MANLNWDSLVGSKTLTAGGYVGDLLEVALLHLNEARDRTQLTDAMVGEVYAATITNAFQTALSFVENDELSKAKVVTEQKQQAILDANLADIERGIALKEAQIAGIQQDNLVKAQQVLESTYNVTYMLPKALEKVTTDIADVSRTIALKEVQITGIAQDNLVKVQQVAKSTFEVTELLPKELEKSTASINDINRGIALKEAQITSMGKDNLLKDEQKKKAAYEVTDLLPVEKSKGIASIADIERSVALKEAQATGIAQDNLVKVQNVIKSEFEVNNLLPKELAKIAAEVTDLSRSSAVKEAQINSIADDIHGKEWSRRLAALKMEVDAEVSLYSSKRLDAAPAFITEATHTGTEDSATIAYKKLVDEIPAVQG